MSQLQAHLQELILSGNLIESLLFHFSYLPRKPDIAMSCIPVFRFQSNKSGNEVTSDLEGHPGRWPTLSWPEST